MAVLLSCSNSQENIDDFRFKVHNLSSEGRPKYAVQSLDSGHLAYVAELSNSRRELLVQSVINPDGSVLHNIVDEEAGPVAIAAPSQSQIVQRSFETQAQKQMVRLSLGTVELQDSELGETVASKISSIQVMDLNTEPQIRPQLLEFGLNSDNSLCVFYIAQDVFKVYLGREMQLLDEIRNPVACAATFFNNRFTYAVLLPDGEFQIYDPESKSLVKDTQGRRASSAALDELLQFKGKSESVILCDGFIAYEVEERFCFHSFSGRQVTVRGKDVFAYSLQDRPRSVEARKRATDEPELLAKEGLIAPASRVKYGSKMLPLDERRLYIFDSAYQRAIIVSHGKHDS